VIHFLVVPTRHKTVLFDPSYAELSVNMPLLPGVEIEML
jgi:hypothetical protein